MKLTLQRSSLYATQEQWNDKTFDESKLPQSQVVDAGSTVDYRGHVIGGMVAVEYNGRTVIIHPRATKELA